jgi:hypothetical protein
MAQPDYVPLQAADRVRRDEKLPAAVGWRADRPADHDGPGQPMGRHLGTPAPDGGYGLKLMKRLVPRLKLTERVNPADTVAGCFGVGVKRAGLFGRAPVLKDFEIAATVWGFLGAAPADLVAFRKPLFAGCEHDYWAQRDISDRTPEATLRMQLPEIEKLTADWKQLLVSD